MPPCFRLQPLLIAVVSLLRTHGGDGIGQCPAGATLVTRSTSHVTSHTSHVTGHTSHVTRHTSHVTHHTSRHTSHVTSHVTRQVLQLTCSSHLWTSLRPLRGRDTRSFPARDPACGQLRHHHYLTITASNRAHPQRNPAAAASTTCANA